MGRNIPLGLPGVMSMRMRRMLEEMARLETSGASGSWSPAVDIAETPEAVIMVVEIPGVKREDLKILVDGDVVRVYGVRHPTLRDPGAQYHRMEIETGDFVRSFRIGVPFQPDKVTANLSDGLLCLRLPK